jgi:hypothetical protein
MATYTKYYQFVEDLIKGVHDFSTDTFKVALSNGTPLQTHALLASISELATANGYTAGGATTTIGGTTHSTGTITLTATDPAAWTASGAGITFRYAALYNTTASGVTNPLIAYWDNGSSTTVTSGNTLQVDFGAALATLV